MKESKSDREREIDGGREGGGGGENSTGEQKKKEKKFLWQIRTRKTEENERRK